MKDGKPYVTDNGVYVLDCTTGPIADAPALDLALHSIPGVSGTGLFIKMAHTVMIQDGDKVEVRHGTVFINDQPIPQKLSGTANIDIGGFEQKADKLVETLSSGKSYTTYQVNPDDPAENSDHPFLVPKGEYFFMADNRDNSLDSRFSPDNDGVGFVPAENLEGKAELVLLSWSKGASLFKPWTWVMNARPSRFFNILH